MARADLTNTEVERMGREKPGSAAAELCRSAGRVAWERARS